MENVAGERSRKPYTTNNEFCEKKKKISFDAAHAPTVWGLITWLSVFAGNGKKKEEKVYENAIH